MNAKTNSSTTGAAGLHCARAFTLIELMVVIGIIAVLIALVMPAIGNAKKQARVAATRATVTVLETGIEQFRADTTIGGSYPPSDFFSYVSPHTLTTNPGPPVGGASLLAWALAGADLLGTPGFRDLDGNGRWGDNSGSANDDPATCNLNLYAIHPLSASPSLQGKPVHHRSGPFVDVSKMSFPKQVSANPPIFVLDKLDTKPQMSSLCFLDSFGQPILYYRANPVQPLMAYDSNQPKLAPGAGIYNLYDNVNITGEPTVSGMNLGAGPIDTLGNYHYLADLGWQNFMLPWLQAPPSDTGQKCFARALWNPNVTATLRPYREDSYLMISAGPDGVFGNADDIANFEVNK